MARYSEKKKQALDVLMRDEVYAQAVAIVTAEGLAGLTMDRIATGVGVSRGTLYNYFADRDALIDYLEERLLAPVLAALRNIADGELPPGEKLAKVVETIFTAVDDDLAMVTALVPDKHSRANRESQMRRRAEALDAIEGIVREGIESGVFKDLPPTLASQIVLDAIVGRIDWMALTGNTLPPGEQVPTFLELVLGGLETTHRGER